MVGASSERALRSSGESIIVVSRWDHSLELCRKSMGKLTRQSCGSGFWGGQHPSLAHYVTGMGPRARTGEDRGAFCEDPFYFKRD